MRQKAVVGLLTLAVTALMMLAGCTAGPVAEPAPDQLAGKWILTGARHDGVDYSLEELRAFGIEPLRTIHFIDAEQVVLAVGVEDDTRLGATAYTFDGAKVTIPEAGMVLEYRDARLLYQSGDVLQVYERMPEEDAAPAP